jgi:glycosyltransferase involved in cell wall biosynthesis
VEYIIIDGGSDDGTIEIIKKYESKLKYWISEKDNGMYDAINKGFKHATGEIYAYINADDRYYNNTVELVVENFLSSDTDFIFGNCDFIDEKSNVMYTYKSLALPIYLMKGLNRLPFAQQTCFWKSEIYNSIGGFNTRYKYVADTNFFYSILLNKYKYSKINHVLAAFRQHSNAISSNQILTMAQEHESILEELDISENILLRLSVESIMKLYNMPAIIHKKLKR